MTPTDPKLQLCATIRQELDNMGRALTCSLCLSTFKDAVMVPNCCHVYCRACVIQALAASPKCPLCKQRCTKRSLVDETRLSTLAIAYKVALRNCGLAPIRYDPNLYMTQVATPSAESNLKRLHEQLQLSRLFTRVKAADLVTEGQSKVVQLNERALLDEVRKKQQQQEDGPTLTQMAREQSAADHALEEMEEELQENASVQSEDRKPSAIEAAAPRQDTTTPLEDFSLAQDDDDTMETAPSIIRDNIPLAQDDDTAPSVARLPVEQPPIPSHVAVNHDSDDDDDDEPASRSQFWPTEAQRSEAFNPFSIGTVVDVQARTWPGMNKQGGVAKVTGYNISNDTPTYHVQYILGGREKNVDAVFVQKHDDSKGRVKERGEKVTSTRILKQKENVLPPSLLEQLKKEGFDTEGIIDPSSLAPSRSAKKRVRIQEPAEEKTPKRPKLLERVKNVISRKSCNKVAPEVVIKEQDVGKLALQHYKKQWTKQTKINIIASGLSEHEKGHLESMVKKSKSWSKKVVLSKSFQKKTSICVTQVDTAHPATAKNRTLKTMQASLAGIPIVSTAWLSDCLKEKSLIEPTTDSTQLIRNLPFSEGGETSKEGVLRLAARKGNNSSYNMLKNHAAYLCGNFSPRQKELDILSLLRQAGATVLSSNALKARSKSRDPLILICGDNNTLSESAATILAKHPNLIVGTEKWLFDSISAGEILGTDIYQPTDKRIDNLWSLSISNQATPKR